ncbi:MAG: hypothetical protein H8E17_02645 [Deltaproteobacteria bacterium]|nr:hypothetical protein [Deltaproteobacteria bacterium]
MKIKIYLLLITCFCVIGSGCSKKTPPRTTPAEPNQAAEPEPPKPVVVNLPKLEYADDMEKLRIQIADILNNIQTSEDVEQAIKTLRPLGRQYAQLSRDFGRRYLDNGGPTLNKFKRYPKDVQQAVMAHLKNQTALEQNVLNDFYSKNLPKKMTSAVADAAFPPERYTSSMMALNILFELQKRPSRRHNPYVRYNPNRIPRSEPSNDPNSSIVPNLPVDPNTLVDPNWLADPNRP